MIYAVVFIISIVCTFFAEKSIKSKLTFSFFSAIALILPAALAGCRDIGIGTDTITYSADMFDAIQKHHYSLFGFLQDYKSDEYQGIEFIYLLLNYIVSLFFDQVAWFHFFLSLVILFFIYLAAYENRKAASMWLVMTLFLFLFYNASLNIMRQSIAIAMTVYAFKYIENKQWIKATIWAVIIFSAHSSGIFFVILMLLHKISYLKNTKTSLRLKIVFAAATSLFFVYFSSVLTVLTIASDKFSKYSLLYSDEETTITKGLLILYIFLLLVLIFARKFINEKQIRNVNFYIYCKFLGIVFFLTSLVSVTASRISWYLNVLDCIFIPRVLREMSVKNKYNAQILTVVVVIITVFVWYWTVVVNNGNETYPYKSKILGID